MNKPIIKDILEITQQCVRCGMCLPHCPTNKLNNSEGFTPRGRIALWQNLAQSRLEVTPKTQAYLSSCLSCGTCDNNCPAGVEFSALQNLGKSYLIEHKNYSKFHPVIAKLLIRVFSSSKLTSVAHYFLYFYQQSKLAVVFKKLLNKNLTLNSLLNFHKMLPTLQLPFKLQKNYPAVKNLNDPSCEITTSDNKTEVILFTGCVNNLLAKDKVHSAIKLLTTLGIEVNILNKLHCCGALQKHNGYLKDYEKTKKNNSDQLAEFFKSHESINHILTLDTGCHSTILENFVSQNIQINTIEQFIYQLLINDQNLLDRLKRLVKIQTNKIIYYYTPCSQQAIKQPNITKNLLALVFGESNLAKVPEGYGCCGAAGSYMFSQIKNAEQLGKKIIADFTNELSTLDQKNSKIVVCTSNTGCSLHLNRIMLEQQLPITMMSSLELLAGLN